MSTPPVLTGDRRTDRALANIARILGEIANNSATTSGAPGRAPLTHTEPTEYLIASPDSGSVSVNTRTPQTSD